MSVLLSGLELLYRGSLKSCNYRCSYCPFSKHRMSDRELLKDREQWKHFVETVRERADNLRIRSLIVVPYGEALIHSWYWEGIGRISALDGIEAVGAQTNLSFPVMESLDCFQRAGGDRKKLYLWATFHPEMTTAEEFSKKCRMLTEEGVHLCAGAVGVPQNVGLLKVLRAMLPKEVYLWINRMDGLKRPYTQEETEEFLKIDPYFLRELTEPPADPGQCGNRLFVEGNGKLRICNISRNLDMSWDELWEMRQKQEHPEGSGSSPVPVCGQKRCSCYLAYGGRQNFMNRVIFGTHSIFRVPVRAKAVFLDIMGTLITQEVSGQPQINGWVRAGLEGLHQEGIPLFFATTLPYREAKRQCREMWHLFSGGVFAGGAHLVLDRADQKWELIKTIEEDCVPVLEEAEKNLRCRMLAYRSKQGLYKITMLRPEPVQWREEERKETEEQLHDAGIHGIRVIAEENCLQILSERATKAEGVRLICRELHIAPEDTVAAGDSAEDAEMLRICSKSMAV